MTSFLGPAALLLLLTFGKIKSSSLWGFFTLAGNIKHDRTLYLRTHRPTLQCCAQLLPLERCLTALSKGEESV